MAYEAKTNWKLDDTVMPDDMNRIEQGIHELNLATGDMPVKVLNASAENIVDFNGLVETGIYIIKNATSTTTLNGYGISSNAEDRLIFVQNTYYGMLYQKMIMGNCNMAFRQYYESSLTWTAWKYRTTSISFTIPTTGWTSSSPYYWDFNYVQAYANDNGVTIIPEWSHDRATRKAQQEAFGCVSKIETFDGFVRITCDDAKPTTEIPVRMIIQRW